MPQTLIILAGPDKGRLFPLSDDVALVVGRGIASDTRIRDPQVSRVHCRLEVQNGRAWLEDEPGSGGTLLRGQPVIRSELRSGDVFQIGQTQIRYDAGAGAEESTLHGGVFAPPVPPRARQDQVAALVGRSLGSFELLQVIATGRSGLLFKAQDQVRPRVAAVKVLFPDQFNSDDQQERFVRAMRTMLPIRHPNIVELYNAGKTGPYCWTAMEYIDGESLSQVIQRIGVRGMLDWRTVWRVALYIARALHAADEHKIVHRNLSPTNLLRRHTDQVCLLGDLMLAKATQ